MTHEHEISGSVPLVVEGEVVDVAEHRLGANSVRGVLFVDRFAEPLHQLDGVFHDRLLLTAAFFLLWQKGNEINQSINQSISRS